jgi:hypothetical protein
MMRIVIAIALLAATTCPLAKAEIVRAGEFGSVDLSKYACVYAVSDSLGQVCYDPVNLYLLVRVSGAYYMNCNISVSVLDRLLRSPELDAYYTYVIRSPGGGSEYACDNGKAIR